MEIESKDENGKILPTAQDRIGKLFLEPENIQKRRRYHVKDQYNIHDKLQVKR
jgi:hypothetical protein